jgi:hypothetical protein
VPFKWHFIACTSRFRTKRVSQAAWKEACIAAAKLFFAEWLGRDEENEVTTEKDEMDDFM